MDCSRRGHWIRDAGGAATDSADARVERRSLGQHRHQGWLRRAATHRRLCPRPSKLRNHPDHRQRLPALASDWPRLSTSAVGSGLRGAANPRTDQDGPDFRGSWVGRTGHFAQQHRNETAVTTADDLWVDVGASSAAGVAALGIELLDPLARHLPPWSLAGEVAGPDAGRRVGCAAVATAAALARAAEGQGETHFVLSAQEVFGWVGLSSFIARGGSFDGATILAPGEAKGGVSTRSADSLGQLGAILETAGIDSVTWVAPSVRAAGSHMERVTQREAQALVAAATAAAGIAVEMPIAWQSAPRNPALRTDHMEALTATGRRTAHRAGREPRCAGTRVVCALLRTRVASRLGP